MQKRKKESRVVTAKTTKKRTKRVTHVQSCCFAQYTTAFLKFSLPSPSLFRVLGPVSRKSR